VCASLTNSWTRRPETVWIATSNVSRAPRPPAPAICVAEIDQELPTAPVRSVRSTPACLSSARDVTTNAPPVHLRRSARPAGRTETRRTSVSVCLGSSKMSTHSDVCRAPTNARPAPSELTTVRPVAATDSRRPSAPVPLCKATRARKTVLHSHAVPNAPPVMSTGVSPAAPTE
jgi:hypothetical protein